MKIFLRIIMLTICFGYCFYSQAMTTASTIFSGPITQQSNPLPFLTVNSPNSWARASATYATGGVTFAYESGLFASTPEVTIGVQDTSGSPTTPKIIVPSIISSSNTSTTVMVFVGTVSEGVVTLVEATPGDFTVYINALGPVFSGMTS